MKLILFIATPILLTIYGLALWIGVAMALIAGCCIGAHRWMRGKG